VTPRSLIAQAAVTAACALVLVPVCANAARAVPARQEVAAVLDAHVARDRPDERGRVVARVAAHRPITGARTQLPVIDRGTDGQGRPWLLVRLPGRTLGATAPPRAGWIRSARTRVSITPWHIVVDLKSRHVNVFRDGRRIRSYWAVVGAPSTPTPRGSFFVEENIRMPASRAGAPFALATSARSRVYQQFDGGPGQIALHGLRNIGGQLGTRVSHGCVRLGDGPITWMARHIAPGVPITIR
jgi:hypothetical protein